MVMLSAAPPPRRLLGRDEKMATIENSNGTGRRLESCTARARSTAESAPPRFGERPAANARPMLQQARKERLNHKPIPRPYGEDCARKSRSSSLSMMGELIPAAPQAERATANVQPLTATRAPNPEPDQGAPAM